MKNTTEEGQIWLTSEQAIQYAISVEDGLFQANKTGLKKFLQIYKSKSHGK